MAEITYLTWTADNLYGKPYVGLREDKPARAGAARGVKAGMELSRRAAHIVQRGPRHFLVPQAFQSRTALAARNWGISGFRHQVF